jgi:hypothetical protein
MTGTDEPETNNITMSQSLEYLLRRTGEECEAWSKLHLMSHKKFKTRETMFNLPIITITACIGFVSGLKLEYEYIHLILGGMSLYASLMKSYFSYLKISQKSENHRIAYIQYGQIANEIRLEMALEPSIRKPVSMLLDLIRIKMKNLNEVSEIIDNHIIHEYLSKLDQANSNTSTIFQMVMREKRSDISNHEHEPTHDVGKPNILKLANRFESYVDIENKVIQMHHNKRGSMSSSDVSVNGNGNGNVNTPWHASESGSSIPTNATDDDDDTVSGTSGVSGIMV